MKRVLSALAALALLFACSPENNPDNSGQVTVVISATSVSLDQPERTLAPGKPADCECGQHQTIKSWAKPRLHGRRPSKLFER